MMRKGRFQHAIFVYIQQHVSIFFIYPGYNFFLFSSRKDQQIRGRSMHQPLDSYPVIQIIYRGKVN